MGDGSKSKLSEKKLKELIVYISTKCAEDTTFAKTKLNKILFFSDFLYYCKTGKSISGQSYIHLQYGPVPKEMKFTLEEMENKDIAIAISQSGPFIQKRVVALREPNLDLFEPDMVSHVDGIIQQVCFEKQIRATWLSRYSHNFMGWLVTKEGEEIPYQTVFLKNKDQQVITERENIRSCELAQHFQNQYGFQN